MVTNILRYLVIKVKLLMRDMFLSYINNQYYAISFLPSSLVLLLGSSPVPGGGLSRSKELVLSSEGRGLGSDFIPPIQFKVLLRDVLLAHPEQFLPVVGCSQISSLIDLREQ